MKEWREIPVGLEAELQVQVAQVRVGAWLGSPCAAIVLL